MKVGVLCEYSGVVRDAFLRHGHDAISCDLLPTDAPGPHIQGDCLEQDWSGFDLLICHPPCTYLCNSGVRWLHTQDGRWGNMEKAAEFFNKMLNLPVHRIAVENPVMHRYGLERVGKCSFTIQPWQFGDDFKKRTCLWTKNLPRLKPTSELDGSTAKADCHLASPGKDRWKLRSTTYRGIAEAMASQWGI